MSRPRARLARLLAQGRAAVLVGLGDSLTYGYLIGRSYLDEVADELRRRYPASGLQVHNHGVCGDTAADGLARLDRALADRPDLLLVQFGLNDAFGGEPVDRYRANLRLIVERAAELQPGCEPLLIPPPSVADATLDELAAPFRAACRALAAEYRCLSAPISAGWRDQQGQASASQTPEPLWLGDGVHPTAAGYRLMARAVLRALDGQA